MTPTDAIRWGWTFLTAWGVLFAVWNFREAVVDNWAVSQVRTRPVDVLRLQVRAEVYLHAMILLALFADFLAGVFALLAQSIGALVALIVSAAALIILSFGHTQRRRKIFQAIRLRPTKDT